MLGFGTKQPVSETEAQGEVARVYHEIRQVLRVTGVNLNFRTWATFEKFFPVMWDAFRPNLETRAFEDAADRIRSEATAAAAQLPRLDAAARLSLGESQRYQIQAALALYHYINPKLLVLTSAVRLALAGEKMGNQAAGTPERIERGEPVRMFPMEMVAEEPDEQEIAAVFADIKTTLELSNINSDYRTLALWPGYLTAAWDRLKPVIGGTVYQRAAEELRESARSLARTLPLPVELSRERVAVLGDDADAIVEKTGKFERLLPPLILNIALLGLDWKPAEELAHSPFPVPSRTTAEVAR